MFGCSSYILYSICRESIISSCLPLGNLLSCNSRSSIQCLWYISQLLYRLISFLILLNLSHDCVISSNIVYFHNLCNSCFRNVTIMLCAWKASIPTFSGLRLLMWYIILSCITSAVNLPAVISNIYSLFSTNHHVIMLVSSFSCPCLNAGSTAVNILRFAGVCRLSVQWYLNHSS